MFLHRIFHTIGHTTARNVTSRLLRCGRETQVIVNEYPLCRWFLRGSGCARKVAFCSVCDGRWRRSESPRSYRLRNARSRCHACLQNPFAPCPCDGVAAEILRVVYNLQPVAFPEGQIGRCPRLVVVQRHKRCHASCRKRKRRGKKTALKKNFVSTFAPDFTAVPVLDDTHCDILNINLPSPLYLHELFYHNLMKGGGGSIQYLMDNWSWRTRQPYQQTCIFFFFIASHLINLWFNAGSSPAKHRFIH